MRTFFIGLSLVTVGALGGVYWYFGGFSGEGGKKLAFIDAYATYHEESTALGALMMAAGGSGSVDRQALFVLLSSILTEDLTPDARLTKTAEASAHLTAIDTSVGAARERVARVRGAIDDVGRAADEFSSRLTRARARALTDLLSAHAELLERALGELGDANKHVRGILEQVERDGGMLTDEHIISINEATGDAETRFDQLTRHFDELASLTVRRDEAYQVFVEHAF